MSDIKEKINEYGILPENLITISTNLHEQKSLGLFSMKKEKLKTKAMEFKKAHNIGFLAWGSFIQLIEKAPIINKNNVSNYYEKPVTKSDNEVNNDEKLSIESDNEVNEEFEAFVIKEEYLIRPHSAGIPTKFLFPEKDLSVKINHFSKISDLYKCKILDINALTIGVDAGFIPTHMSGDALITMDYMGINLTSKEELKSAKKNIEEIKSVYKTLKLKRPEIFDAKKLHSRLKQEEKKSENKKKNKEVNNLINQLEKLSNSELENLTKQISKDEEEYWNLVALLNDNLDFFNDLNDRKKIILDFTNEKIKDYSEKLVEFKMNIKIKDENDVLNHDMKQTAPSPDALKKMLTQPKSRKYSGYTSLNISDVTDEIESFFSNQKFGWLGEAKPTVVVNKIQNSAVIRCYTAKTLVRTWGNSKETAINVIVENKNGVIEYNCGFSGNKAVLSGSSIAGAVLTGGVSLVGNAASAVKDGKLVNSTMEFIDDMMRNQFQNSSGNQAVVQPQIDIAEQIRKLSDLKNDGILTDEEFNIKKAELLKKI